MKLKSFLSGVTDSDKVLLSMTLTTLAVTGSFIPIRWFQDEFKLVITNSIASLLMLIILGLFFAKKPTYARILFALFIGCMMVVIVIINGPFQLNWCFAGMSMLYFTIRAIPAFIYSQSIAVIIAFILWDQVSVQRWFQDVASLNITMMLVFYGSLTKERYNKKLEDIATENAKAATVDALTNLQNRRALESRMNELVHSRRALDIPAALIIVDVDHFKSVNDTYGHSVGDEALILTAKILSDSLRDAEAFRYGGEEFVGLLASTSKDNAILIAERVRQNVEMNFEYPLEWFVGNAKPILKITISIGVAVLDPGDTSGTWIEKADTALYHSKRSGRNKVTLYSETNHSGDEINVA